MRERKIPKPGGSGKVRRLGIPTVTDRVVQAALKLVLEPIFEADFEPVSYGFRPERRAHDAIAEIHKFGTHGYRWVLDADIEACFDRIDHAALMDRVRARVKDKRVLRLVKAFLKAGILTELGDVEDSYTGTPQGGILSPLLANIALSVLDEHLHAPWKPGGPMSTAYQRADAAGKDEPNWRVVRYADDFVVLVRGNADHVEGPARADRPGARTDRVAARRAKTQIVHMSEGFDFLGFHIQWGRKRGTNKWYVYTFIAERPIRSVKAKIRALTPRTSQQDLGAVLIRINQIMRGWTNYFQHAVAQRTFSHLQAFTWWRIVQMMRTRHRWRWKDVRRWLTDRNGRWRPISADGIELFNPEAIPITRYRYRGSKIPNPWASLFEPTHGRRHGEPVAWKHARRVRRAAWGNGPGAIPAPRPRPTQPSDFEGWRCRRCRSQEPPQPRPNRSEPETHPQGCGRWCLANPSRGAGQQIGRRRRSVRAAPLAGSTAR